MYGAFGSSVSPQYYIPFLYKLEKLLPFNHLFHRLDSLVGLFGAGCQPSSTNDPFGLRRVSYGLVRKFEIVQISLHKAFLYMFFYLGPNISWEQEEL